MLGQITGFITSIGVGQIVSNVVRVTTPDNISKAQKVTTAIGGIVLSSLLSVKASKYIEQEIDGMFDNIQNYKSFKEGA